MTSITREKARADLRAWVVATSGKIQDGELKDDTALLEQRIISSLHVADLILFIEELREAPIDIALMNGKTLRSIDAICTTFLGELR
jgi:hypothetical protein